MLALNDCPRSKNNHPPKLQDSEFDPAASAAPVILDTLPTDAERKFVSRVQMIEQYQLHGITDRVPPNAAELMWAAAHAEQNFEIRLSRTPHAHIARWLAIREVGLWLY